jgi:hypothetical protein
MNDRLWCFSGGAAGAFRVAEQLAVRGEPLPVVTHLDVAQSEPKREAVFRLRGIVSNERYVTAVEKVGLTSKQQAIGRPDCSLGAMIPIKKSAAWWALPQDERRAIFEERSRHIAIGMDALPGVARRLHHCRDLESAEPFDFVTWFDFRPRDESRFDDLLGALRRTLEWEYVEREVEVRVER